MSDLNMCNLDVVSVLNDTDKVFLNQGNTMKQAALSVLLEKVKTQTATQVESDLLDRLTDGVFIMFHRAVISTDNCPVAYRLSEWPALQAKGEVADGVLVVEGGKHIVVAPTESSSMLAWGTDTTGALCGTAITDRQKAMEDFTGQARTTAIVANATYSADGAECAPGYCNAYTRANTNGKGLTAGRWWLPSAGELCMMWANRKKIDAALALIKDGVALKTDSAYWSSTESSKPYAWGLGFGYGYLFSNNKAAAQRRVRPVSAFLN